MAGGAGIEDFQGRDLRRTVATNMSRLRVPREDIAKCLNHVGGRGVTGVVYIQDEFREAKLEAFGRWAAKLDGLLGGTVVPMRRDLSA